MSTLDKLRTDPNGRFLTRLYEARGIGWRLMPHPDGGAYCGVCRREIPRGYLREHQCDADLVARLAFRGIAHAVFHVTGRLLTWKMLHDSPWIANVLSRFRALRRTISQSDLFDAGAAYGKAAFIDAKRRANDAAKAACRCVECGEQRAARARGDA